MNLAVANEVACVVCSRIFLAVKHNAQYCGNACRQKGHRLRVKADKDAAELARKRALAGNMTFRVVIEPAVH